MLTRKKKNKRWALENKIIEESLLALKILKKKKKSSRYTKKKKKQSLRKPINGDYEFWDENVKGEGVGV